MSGSALILALALAGAGSVEHPHRVLVNPLSIQLDSKFTRHLGFGLRYAYDIRAGFGLIVGGEYNFAADLTAFTMELRSTVLERPPIASTAVMKWHTWAGLAFSPFAGSLNDRPFRLTFIGGGGPAGGAIVVAPWGPSTLIDIGLRPAGIAAIEGQWAVTETWTVVLGVASRVFTTGDLVEVGDCIFVAPDQDVPRLAGCALDSAGQPMEAPVSWDGSLGVRRPSVLVSVVSLTAGLQARF